MGLRRQILLGKSESSNTHRRPDRGIRSLTAGVVFFRLTPNLLISESTGCNQASTGRANRPTDSMYTVKSVSLSTTIDIRLLSLYHPLLSSLFTCLAFYPILSTP